MRRFVPTPPRSLSPTLNQRVHSLATDKIAPVENMNKEGDGNGSSQPMAIPAASLVGPGSPAVSLTDSPCQSPMFREEDETSGTGESETEELEDGQQMAANADEYEVIQFDGDDDNDMNKVTQANSSPLRTARTAV